MMLNRSLNSDISLLSTKEQRQKRRFLTNLLETEIEDAESTARTLIDIGIYEDINCIIKLLKKSNGHNLLEMLYKLSELNRSTQTINIATERTAKIVFALKAYSHQNNTGEKTKTNLIRDMETVLTLYANQIKQGITLIKNYAPDLPVLDCYPDELNQVWTNLIHNALQAMNHQGTLTIGVEQYNNFLKITIQDTGMGIEPENINKIFDAFFTTKTAGEGSGLGLYIIKKIIDKHSGEISVKSQPGCTVFTVLLPV